MIKFHVFRGETKKDCTAADVTRAVEILKLVFGDAKAYIVEGDNIVYFQNMSMEDARNAAGLQPVVEPVLSIKELPPAPALKKKAKKKTPAVKKTKVKSKVVVKAKTPAKKTVKKTKVKSKVQPNGKAKKVKNNKKPAKANRKAKR